MAAVATKTGVGGSVTLAGYTLEIFKWSADIQRDVHDATGFANATNEREKVGGMHHATGTIEAWYSGTSPDLADLLTENDTGGAMVLQFDTASGAGGSVPGTYAFTAIISSIAVSVDKPNLVTVTASFESSGEIIVVEST